MPSAVRAERGSSGTNSAFVSGSRLSQSAWNTALASPLWLPAPWARRQQTYAERSARETSA
eukprot:5120765-Lingulodinium_polyedra.AAC.1